ncbi:response regulator [Desulfurivibrio alkaliphilus]|uniref:Response regulator receiver modulated metal dependent phosphohydrolase n=1 Tax=Desulfurivibrio alkaliphilus (strain DSM 19089 / UNIQEM U267 / AHT2) TaxID=589865 RepID=D6Z1J4_DESAT|nr:HD domain-containing phosphohydrolase [Desulfurivibrio alkaliphilus]ADH87328.1 response regulator receiver modulated metal dependent phosphohydrolase [Desulfurivibrio alkaliphilus AHT 2]
MAEQKTIKVLIADDDPLVRDAVEKILAMFGYQVTAVSGGAEAVARLTPELDVVVLDINMPGMDGFEALKQINQRDLGVPVIFLTGAGSMEYAVKAVNLGAYDFITKPIEDLDLFRIKIERAVEKRGYVRQERAYKENLEREVREKTSELEEKNRLLKAYSENLEVATLDTMLSLQTALEEKDVYTAGHTVRVTQYAASIAVAMGVSPEEQEVLQRACQVHDIGKLIIDIGYICKPGPLSEKEWEMMRKHPLIGENILRPLSFMNKELTLVRHHHERLDGKGYPDGIGGDEIDLLTRIITVADSYDAMTSRRSYRRNLNLAEAVAEMNLCAGSQFDPEVVKVFVEVLNGKANP